MTIAVDLDVDLIVLIPDLCLLIYFGGNTSNQTNKYQILEIILRDIMLSSGYSLMLCFEIWSRFSVKAIMAHIL